jgi:F-type H+-transporting ATPase subunit a
MLHISLAAEKLFYIGNFAVTNSLLMSWIVMLGLVLVSLIFTRKLSTVPKGFQNFMELVVEKLFELVDSVTQDKKLTKKFFPIIATLFIFIILSNWIGLLPGLGTIGINMVHGDETILAPFIRAGSADLNFTLALAIVAVTSVQFFGITTIGFFKYFKRFVNFGGPVKFFVGILELISEVAKMISFSFRLFGNVFAGEVLLTVILFLVPYFVPLPFLMLELFVGFVQALVFAMLTLVFLKMATLETH